MELEIINPDEQWSDTMAFIDANYVDKEAERIALSECKIYQRGMYLIVEKDGKVFTSESTGANYCWLQTALEFMKPSNMAKWKTVGALRTFRQALRENAAQGMGLEDMFYTNISLYDFNAFLRVARSMDEQHHGSVTF